MNDQGKKLSDLFTPSGCLTGDALMLYVSGSLTGAGSIKAEQHLAGCPLCADAAEGLRMWLKENKSTTSTTSAISEEPFSETSESAGKQSPAKASPYKTGSRFHARTEAINQHIRQRLYSRTISESGKIRQLSYKPFIWVAAAAFVVLFIGGFYVVWLQSRMTELKLAEERASQMLMLQKPLNPDTLTILKPDSPIILAMNEKKELAIPPTSEQIRMSTDHSGMDEMNLTDANKAIARVSDMIPPQEVTMEKPDVLKEEAKVAEANRYNPEAMSKSSVTALNKAETSDDAETIFTVIEEMPSFPGGDAARNKFLSENIVYPRQAAENRIQGTVYISFIVNTEGNIENVKILRGIGGGCDEEASRVVKLMPRWKAGKQNGKIVSVFYTMPVKFRLQ